MIPSESRHRDDRAGQLVAAVVGEMVGRVETMGGWAT